MALDKEKPCTRSLRGLNMAPAEPTTVELTAVSEWLRKLRNDLKYKPVLTGNPLKEYLVYMLPIAVQWQRVQRVRSENVDIMALTRKDRPVPLKSGPNFINRHMFFVVPLHLQSVPVHLANCVKDV
jgi:hypothetical protein